MKPVEQIRAAIASDRCDGDSEYAQGVNAACRRHLAMIDAILGNHVTDGVECWCNPETISFREKQ